MIRKGALNIVVGVVLLAFGGCSDDDPLSVNDLGFWVGEYEIHTIGGEPVDCEVIFRIPETIVITNDNRFQVLSRCGEGGVLVEGDFGFDQGVFDLFVSTNVQEPDDIPEFQMQIFQGSAGDVRIYRCANRSSTCSIRLGNRIK